MTDQAINAEIAEACGWQAIPNADGDLTEPSLTRSWIEWHGPNGEQEEQPPSYTTDLNAMHEAELVFRRSARERVDYERELQFICANDHSGGREYGREVWNATARQRSEAFLRTLGKWRE